MNIDIGSDGKILGTKKVSPNGQVSGLKEYAGMEVLIILPGTNQKSDVLLSNYVDGMRGIVEMQMKLFFERYEELKNLYKTPAEAAKAFMLSTSPKNIGLIIEDLDKWIKDQISLNEKIISKFISSSSSESQDEKEDNMGGEEK
ncbi:MAG: hypothetical protein ACP5RS_05180 [Thermoplasmata archaeon]